MLPHMVSTFKYPVVSLVVYMSEASFSCNDTQTIFSSVAEFLTALSDVIDRGVFKVFANSFAKNCLCVEAWFAPIFFFFAVSQ